MDLSLRDLAERSGVSAPMLSQVERGETSPTLSVAERIAGGLELSLSQLLRLDETDGVSVVRAGERRRGGGRGHRYEVLTPPLPGLRAEVSLHALAAGRVHRRPGRPARCTSPAAARRRVVETGPVRFVCGGRAHDLDERRRRDLRRRPARTTSRTPARGEARFYAVVAAGLRRS